MTVAAYENVLHDSQFLTILAPSGGEAKYLSDCPHRSPLIYVIYVETQCTVKLLFRTSKNLLLIGKDLIYCMCVCIIPALEFFDVIELTIILKFALMVC